MAEECIKNDPSEMKIASDASWICELFQSYSLSVEEKQHIIKEMTRQFKIKRLKRNG